MTVKLVALDLDGTTLNHKNILTEKTKQTIKVAIERGIDIIPVTGRCYQSLPKSLTGLKGIDYAITSNGAEIRCLEKGQVIYSDYISAKGAKEVSRALKRFDGMVEIYVNGKAYIEKKAYEKVAGGGVSYRDQSYVLETRIPVIGVKQLLEVHEGKIEKIAVYFPCKNAGEKLKKSLSALEHVSLTSSGENNLELGGIQTNKAGALRHFCHMKQMDMKQVMAVGDSPNDQEMLKAAGLPVAVDNACKEVKSIALYTVAPNSADGVSEAINRFALCPSSD